MSSIQLVFGVYTSPPLGEAEGTRESNYQRFIKPCLSTLYLFPEIPAVLYYSGILLQWLEKKHPEFLDVLGEMVSRKQVELLGGGFYDPIFSLIPRSDALGQIEQLTTYIRKKFGKRPRGAWIPDFEWESWLASTFKTCGMDYTFLGDFHFQGTGVADRYEPYLTEDQGKTISVFPVSQQMSERLFLESPQKAVQTILSHRDESKDRLLTLFLRWDTVDPKLLEDFFLELRAHPKIKLTQPHRYLRAFPPVKKTYFPCGSRVEKISGVGLYRQLLVLYPDSNFLYAKMQYTHLLVNGVRGDKHRKNAAREELWKGQFGKAYGSCLVEGGNGIRKHAYKALITAEKITRQKGIFIPSIVVMDFDMDGKDEFLLQGNELNAYVHMKGGCLFELDTLSKPWNYIDPGVRCFRDRFLPLEREAQSWESLREMEQGPFAEAPYTLLKCDRERNELVLEHRGKVRQGQGSVNLRLVKKIIVKGNTLNVYYSLTNMENAPVKTVFGSEVCLSFSDAERGRMIVPDQKGTGAVFVDTALLLNAGEVIFEDESNMMQFQCSTLEPARIWVWPRLFSRLCKGSKEEYLASCVFPHWQLELPPHGTWENRLSLRTNGL